MSKNSHILPIGILGLPAVVTAEQFMVHPILAFGHLDVPGRRVIPALGTLELEMVALAACPG